ncbi:MAG: LysR family transcriptional regulator [Polyangiaceae bacterium]
MIAPSEAVDLALLNLFDHLLRERHVTRAALRAGLSQPAMSRALLRLRETFGDPLFVRGPRGVTPTARAEALGPAVRDLLERARDLLRPVAFEPARVDRTFVIGATDYVEVELLPRLAKRLARDAPRASVSIRPFTTDSLGDLASGRLDVVITAKGALANDLYAQTIREDRFACAVRREHPTAGRRLSLDRYIALSHVLIAPRGDPGSAVDTELAKRGRQRHVAVRTVSFFGACRTVSSTDLILTAPGHVLESLSSPFGLRLLAPPIRLPRVVLQQVWHARAHTDPAHAWFRGILHACSRG